MTMPIEQLSLAALGLILRLVLRGITTFNLEDAQHAEAGRMGKDRALSLLSELKRADLVHRTRGGYILSGSCIELFNNSGKHRKPRFPELSTTIHIESREHDQRVVGELLKVPENTDFPEVQTEPNQLSLIGCPEPPPPVAPPPSPVENQKPTKPKRPRNPPPPDEVKALYAPLFELTKSPRKGEAAMGVYTKARDLWQEFQATPDQVATFWEWFKTFSRAAQQAAREQRPLNPPKPRQVYEDWLQFIPWYEARQAAAAREAARQAERERQRAEERETRSLDPRDLHPFKGKYGGLRASQAPIPVATD